MIFPIRSNTVSQGCASWLTCSSPSLSLSRSRWFQWSGIPAYRFQPSWWCPTSSPHCQCPALPAKADCSNICSSRPSKHNRSTLTSLQGDAAISICFCHALWTSSSGLSDSSFGVSFLSREAKTIMWACAIGSKPNHFCLFFGSCWAICSSNQLAILARSLKVRSPVNGTRDFCKFYFPSSSHFFAGMVLFESVSGESSNFLITSMEACNASWTSGVYWTKDGSERISSMVGISQVCFHFPSYNQFVRFPLLL